MTILEKIIAYKQPELAKRQKEMPLSGLQQTPAFKRKTYSLKKALTQSGSSGIIAEFKRQSPSKPAINLTADVLSVTTAYQISGAAALSVLTDTYFFGGKNRDLEQIRPFINIPVLRKDFIFDPYQIYEAKSIGADAVLLIAAILSKEQIVDFSKLANELGLEVLLEIHNRNELTKISPDIDILGVNNRNLKTFEVSLENAKSIAKHIPEDLIKISESGIHSAEDIFELKPYGYRGFLIGELFMKTPDPGQTCHRFIKTIQK